MRTVFIIIHNATSDNSFFSGLEGQGGRMGGGGGGGGGERLSIDFGITGLHGKNIYFFLPRFLVAYCPPPTPRCGLSIAKSFSSRCVPTVTGCVVPGSPPTGGSSCLPATTRRYVSGTEPPESPYTPSTSMEGGVIPHRLGPFFYTI